jgi:hypothetical protein
MKELDASDFRSKRLMLEDNDFAVVEREDQVSTDLIDEDTWKSITSLPDDVSIRTTNVFGSHLKRIWEHWDLWNRLTIAIQDLTNEPQKSPTAIAASDAGDEFQAAVYAALIGFYRVAFSCLRNVIEQTSIATQLALSNNSTNFLDWRNGESKIYFGWAADMLPKNPAVATLEQHLKAATEDSLFSQSPKGFARRLFVEVTKYTHGASGFTDADLRKSNGPIFVPGAFVSWYSMAVKTYALALHELKLVHPVLDELPYGPPITLDDLRQSIVAEILTNDPDYEFFQSLMNFWTIPNPKEARKRLQVQAGDFSPQNKSSPKETTSLP